MSDILFGIWAGGGAFCLFMLGWAMYLYDEHNWKCRDTMGEAISVAFSFCVFPVLNVVSGFVLLALCLEARQKINRKKLLRGG